jgi:hypothetical protein
VTPVSFHLAKSAPSPGRAIGVLLRQAFSRKRLIKSSYAGQRRKISDGTIKVKPGLKKYQKMADIQGNWSRSAVICFYLPKHIVTHSLVFLPCRFCSSKVSAN